MPNILKMVKVQNIWAFCEQNGPPQFSKNKWKDKILVFFWISPPPPQLIMVNEVAPIWSKMRVSAPIGIGPSPLVDTLQEKRIFQPNNIFFYFRFQFFSSLKKGRFVRSRGTMSISILFRKHWKRWVQKNDIQYR